MFSYYVLILLIDICKKEQNSWKAKRREKRMKGNEWFLHCHEK